MVRGCATAVVALWLVWISSLSAISIVTPASTGEAIAAEAGTERHLLATLTASHPLAEANKRDAELAAKQQAVGVGLRPSHDSYMPSTGKDQDDQPVSEHRQIESDRIADSDAVSTETADTGLEARNGHTKAASASLGLKLFGGLRGHLLAQQKAKGLDPPRHPADLGRKGREHGAPPPYGIYPDEEEDFELPDDELLDDYEDPLVSWWQRGSHWQPPVNPFVVQRPVRPPRNHSKSSLTDFTSYLPGMRPKQAIPKIFHQVYLAGEDALHEEEQASANSLERWPPVKAEWRASCMALNPDWEFRLWNLSAMTHLLAHSYPWFLPTFLAYPQLIHKVDAVRPFIMHAFGGVYTDMDVECIQPLTPFLEDHELVFQEEDFGQKSLVNSAIAGVAGHRFWEIWQQIMMERAPQLQKKRSIFSRADSEVVAVLNATGPWALRAAFQRFSRDYGLLHLSYVGAWTINGTNVMVYPLGTWFVPCLWDNVACHAKVEALVQQHSIPIWLAGHHKNAGSWFKAAGFSRFRSRWRGPVRLLALVAVAALCFWLVRRKRWRRPVLLDRSQRTQPTAKRKD